MGRDFESPTHLVGTTGASTFRVEPAHATTLFGEQDVPPGLPAAADADPAESVRVLGTPHLLSRIEFTGRESLDGGIPPGTGVVGEGASVSHTSPATVGTELRVVTEVVAVDGAAITYDGRVATAANDREIGTAEVVFRLVERSRFRRGLEPDDR